MVKNILLGCAILIVGFLGFIAVQPADFRVQRSATIQAAPEIVFAQINDFHKWEAWSPWAKRDPQAKNTFAGPPSGQGATFSWDGNNEVGSGKMTISDSVPPNRIIIDLEFFKPMAGKNLTIFEIDSTDSASTLTWTMTGQNNFAGRLICFFMSMDKMVGGDFEQGLANIKAIAEASNAK